MSKMVRVRLIELGKKQYDLKAELEKRGMRVANSELSEAINGHLNTPKGSRIRQECLYILDEWEKGARA